MVNVPVFLSGFGPDYGLGNNITLAQHEVQHTYQGQVTGPLYIPLNLIGGVASSIVDKKWNGPLNFMETGPQSTPPRATPW